MAVEDDRAALSAALGRVARGDEAALRFVYDRTSAKLFGVCLRILKSRIEAEDVLQDVYLTVWRKADGFDPSGASPITWLATMTRNRAIDRLRAIGGRRLDTGLEGFDAGAPSALAGLVWSEDVQRLQCCLSELDGRHADAVRAAFFEGLTYDALARRLEAPLGAVKGWVRGSLMHLRTCLEA